MPANDISIRRNIQPSASARQPSASAPRPTSAAAIAPVDEDELVRKEFRVRSDQVTRLATLRRRINKTRNAAEKGLDPSEKSPSMTDRILARVALDYLLEHEDDLQGWTEQDLLNSLRKAKD